MSILKPELIMIDLDAQNSDDALRQLATLFVKHGFARDTYPQAIIDREKLFPTALPTEACDIAIPHCDRDHVLKSAIGVGTLKNPVAFQQMAEPETTLHPRVLFMLAIDDPNGQLDTLMSLMAVLQEKKLLEELLAANAVEAIMETLNPKFTLQGM